MFTQISCIFLIRAICHIVYSVLLSFCKKPGYEHGKIMDINEYTRKKLRQLRIEKGLSLVDIAQLIGRDVGYVHSIETGERLPRVLPVLKFCEVLNVNPHNFYDEFYGRK